MNNIKRYTYEEMISIAKEKFAEDKIIKFLVRNAPNQKFRRRDLEIKDNKEEIFRYPVYINFVLVDPIRKIFFGDTGGVSIIGEQDFLNLINEEDIMIINIEVL